MRDDTPTGLLVLHGNRLEALAEALLHWLARHPLAPLESETLLVQSNGMAEWLKMTLASGQGVCAATRIELPARFIWRAYRAVLGREAVPPQSPLDKLPLTWRLMSLLPALASQPGFAPVAGFLADGDPARRLQLAERLADLFDQYQVYRADWLHDWARGVDSLRADPMREGAQAIPVPEDQRWQPALWRAVQAGLDIAQRAGARAQLHRRFVAALREPVHGAGRAFPALPRRVVLFGTTHIPHQTLEAIAALSAHCQVLLAVPNPCQYHWADIIDGRELLRFERRRHPWRRNRDLSALPLQDMHAHGHPLLAAWGRQSRDFIRQLDAFDDAQAAARRFAMPRVDLFDESAPQTLLAQVQASVRDLLPLEEHAWPAVPNEDRSIVFQVAHSAQREVEVLHDQLLQLLARPPGLQPLAPRDIVVMVPDIERFAPAIRSVFGQHPRRDPRHIPWGIADQPERGRQPMLIALEEVLRAPHQRFGVSQVRDLLGVPALAARFGIDPAGVELLGEWIADAGIRWGLNAAHREGLGLGQGGEQNTWRFGLQRMLLGYATGELPAAGDYAGIEPYPEVAGLSAGLAGALDELLRVLTEWWRDAVSPRPPGAWALRLRSLLESLFRATDDTDRGVLAALDQSLGGWLEACEAAGFTEPLDVGVVREAWLGAVDAPGLSRRFRAGGVTFCTLLPLRAIPFRVVCLLGMNDGDYPRRGSRMDFDLMGLPGQARPGDRSRRDDDRQLMLDALLSAREVLYISWAGRSQRDNQPQPPSVLVAQLRDYLGAGWGPAVVDERTTEHPLQPFSRRYFEPAEGAASGALFTHAREWRAAHAGDGVGDRAEAAAVPLPPPPAGGAQSDLVLTLDALTAFLRNPVQAFFRHRLRVSFGDRDEADADDETFIGQGLEQWAWTDTLLQACRRAIEALPAAGGPTPADDRPAQIRAVLGQELGRLRRSGSLPLAGPGRLTERSLGDALLPMLSRWQESLADLPDARERLRLQCAHPDDATLQLDDWLAGARAAGKGARPVWIELQASRLCTMDGKRKAEPLLRESKLLGAWVRCLASAACGSPTDGILIGQGALVRVRAPDPDEARPVLHALMLACRDGLRGNAPLPTAAQTGIALLRQPGKARETYEGRYNSPTPGEGAEPSLARLFPDYDSLAADPGFEAASQRLYQPFLAWLGAHAVLETSLSDAPEPEAIDD
ncbi:MAG: exodeoxyribonuclease V subunit gamma [Betaproteobacteria bacterium]|nr:exodeoxyribonuclease V subunit gamma [Betaproteobacteria bacterium]